MIKQVLLGLLKLGKPHFVAGKTDGFLAFLIPHATIAAILAMLTTVAAITLAESEPLGFSSNVCSDCSVLIGVSLLCMLICVHSNVQIENKMRRFMESPKLIEDKSLKYNPEPSYHVFSFLKNGIIAHKIT